MIQTDLAPLARDIDTLTLLPGNPRRGDIAAVARSLKAFGQRKPIVANAAGVVIAGNHTLQAARSLGWSEIAVVTVDDDAVKGAAYALADNRTAELGGYDDVALAALIAEVQDDADLIAATGWDENAIAALLGSLPSTEDADVADAGTPVAVPAYAPKITTAGDVWVLGRHRVMAGDARNADEVATLLAGATINVAVTSPPYAEQRAYDESSGFRPIPPDEYVEWFAPIAANVAANLAPDGSWFVNIKPSAEGLDTNLYVLDLVIAHVRSWGWHFATEFCWERNGVPKSVTRRFKNQFEPIYQFALGDWKMRPEEVRHPSDNVPINVGPGGGNTSWENRQGVGGHAVLPQARPWKETRTDQNGPAPTKRDTNTASRRQGRGGDAGDAMGQAKARRHGVTGDGGGEEFQGVVNYQPGLFIQAGMAFPGNRLPTFAGSHEATGHSAAFPVGLPQFFVKAYTDLGDAIYDPFMGSGSTLLAAHIEGRTGYGMELSPGYVDIICKRFQLATGIVPILERTGERHDFTVDR